MTRKLTVLDIFSGIGGFSLGLERTGGFKTVAFCEIEPFCRKVLHKHWPDVPCHDDVRTLDATRLGSVDVITGGFPCQKFSTASHGRRIAPDLWPDMLRVIDDVRPRIVIAENVQESPIRRAKKEVCDLGYGAFYRRIGAHEGGAGHQRNRWWLCAYTDDKSQLHCALNAKMALLPEICKGVWGWQSYARTIRVAHGIPDRVHRLKGLGNAVVPQIPELIGRAILEAERQQQ